MGNLYNFTRKDIEKRDGGYSAINNIESKLSDIVNSKISQKG